MLRAAYRIGFISFALAQTAALTACSGGGSSAQSGAHLPPPPGSQPQPVYTAAPADVTIGLAPLPSPFEPSGTFALPRTRETLHAHLRSNTLDHEAQGVFLSGYGAPYNAIFATQSAYEALQRPLQLTGGSGDVQVYAPTLHLGWGGCLEASSFYEGLSSGTSAQFTVYNLCLPSPALVFSAAIDAAFIGKYVKLTPDGTPAYAVEMFTPDESPSNASTWTAILYNYRDAKYDALVTVPANGGTGPNASGWSVTELYDAAGACPKVAPVSVNNAQLHDALADTWDALAPSMPGGVTASVDVQASSSNDCFLGGSGAAPTLNFSLLTPSSYWHVTSPR